MERKVFISVSTDPVKEYQAVVEYAKELQGKADMLHCDIMDGKFVERKTYDDKLVKNINDNSLIMLDVHLMVEEPFEKIEDYLKAGANILTVHYEAFKDKDQLVKALKLIKSYKALAGLSFSPSTKVKDIKLFAHDYDVILVMSVVPGASGQSFMPEALDRIKELAQFRKNNNYKFKIEVDGGINEVNAKQIIDAGADMLVSGSYVFKSENKKKAIEKLKNNA